MKEICVLDNESECSGNKDKTQLISFYADDEEYTLSDDDLRYKEKIKSKLINSATKCYFDGECDGLDIIALRWKKCKVCDSHLPYLKEKVLEPLSEHGIPINYKEYDAKEDEIGNNLFKSAGCQGTPCILVFDKSNNKYKKAYDGAKQEIASMSDILGLPNPFFYDISDIRPKNMLKYNKPNGDLFL